MEKTLNKNNFRYLNLETLDSMLTEINCNCGIDNILIRYNKGELECIYDNFNGDSYDNTIELLFNNLSEDLQIELLIAICEYVFSDNFKLV